MDLFAPCRSCLRCLPFFQVSPPSSPRPSTAAAAAAAAATAQAEEASKASPSPDRGECTQTSADAPLQGQDLSTSDKKGEPHPPLHSSVDGGQLSVIAENEGKPMSEIIIAPPVSSPPASNKYTGASFHENAGTNKTTTLPDLPLHVPFINDISFSTSGLMPLPSPMTPAPFGTGYGYPAGQYHPSPHIYPPGNDDSHDKNVPSQEEHGNSHVEHITSHDGHGPLHHGHNHSHHGHHDDSHHGQHDDSHHGHHGHGPPDESLALAASEYTPTADTYGVDNADVSDTTHDTSPLALETSNSTPGFLDMETKHEGKNGDAGAIANVGADSALIETYHSEPIVPPGDLDDDDSYTPEEGLLGHNVSLLGRRRRRRDHFKDQFKGISQQIKQGGHHIKEESNKHLQTIISNMNKQAQQIEQSGSFFVVPRANNN